MKRPPALLLGLDLHQMGVARSLGRRGIVVQGIDQDPYPIAAFSRYCRRIKAPSLSAPGELLDLLLDYGKKAKQRPILFSGDRYASFLIKYREQLDSLFEIPLPSNDILNKILNKKQLYQEMLARDILIPDTFFPEHQEDLMQIRDKVTFPCILKPSNSVGFYRRFKLKVLPVNNQQELLAKFYMLRDAGYEVIVQEIISGRDNTLYTFGSYLNEKSQVLAVFSGRKLRQFPVKYGLCTLGESIYEQEVIELGTKVLKTIGYQGISQVEFKRDEADGRLKLIEINARTWTWHMLATACGVDLSYLAYSDKAGLRLPEIKNPHTEGLKWICLPTDLVSAFRYIFSRELGIREWVNSLSGQKKYAIFAGDDLLPVPGFLLSSIFNIFSN